MPHYTVIPNFSSTVRTTTVNFAGQTVSIQQAANTEPEVRRIVRLLYDAFFGRGASASEVDFHVASLGEISRAQMAENRLRSTEFYLGGAYIAGLYVGLLDRDAEYGGWEFNRNAIVRATAQ